MDAIVLDHVHGVHRGTRTRLDEAVELLGTGTNATIHFPPRRAPQVQAFHGTLTRQGDDYLFAVEPVAPVRVNDRPFSGGMLSDGDLIELGDGGPIMRYRHIPIDREATFRSLRDVMNDCVDSARIRAKTPIGVAARIATELPIEMIARSAPGTRVVSVVLLALLVMAMGWLGIRTLQIERAISDQSIEFAEALSLFRPDGNVNPDELKQLREDLQSTSDRLGAIENTSVGEILERVSGSIVFVQGAFGFRDPSGRELRTMLDENGNIMRDPRGQPLASPNADGPVFTQLYTGTAFVVSDTGLLVTNRHVAIPWEFDPAAQRAMQSGLKPFMHRLVGFIPGRADPFDVVLVTASDDADVALLSSELDSTTARPIPLADVAPKLGDRVLVLGYPTGIRALLARTDPGFVNALLDRRPQPDFWEVAHELSRGGHMAPLISEGIVGQITSAAVVYDAATTHGGSGGPVLNAKGDVVAVNAAIVPEFGGANQGVPVSDVRKLISRW